MLKNKVDNEENSNKQKRDNKKQNIYRDALLMEFRNRCPFTRNTCVEDLAAAHIKPYIYCTNEEEFDVNNGFIMDKNCHELFDKGLISISKNKTILISNELLNNETYFDKAEKLGILEDKRLIYLETVERENYIDYHRQNIFIKD